MTTRAARSFLLAVVPATTCPAAVTPLGTACAGSAGPVTLATQSLP